VPKNNFGNIDLYVPSMLPHGAAHVPCEIFTVLRGKNIPLIVMILVITVKGAVKVARQLGFDYAEAVVGVLAPISSCHVTFYRSFRLALSSRNGKHIPSSRVWSLQLKTRQSY
jgi:hypothetical protein